MAFKKITRSLQTHFYDPDEHILQITSGGSRTLHDVYKDGTVDIVEWVIWLGHGLPDCIGTQSISFYNDKNIDGPLC